jgi:hypothetical protein
MGRVVTMDPADSSERAALWAALPESMRGCIDARRIDSHEGMRGAVAAGEMYDGALLDSLHTEEHLFGELTLAQHLVRAGGPIVVHDWRALPEVDRALVRAQSELGFHVVRLLAEGGVEEDAGLGIAIAQHWNAV